MTAQDFSNALAQGIKTVDASLVQVDGRRGYALSGTVWDEHTVVTTSRAVERDDDITVTLSGGETHAATLQGRDPSTDLALLKLEATLTVPAWQETEGLEVGHLALLVGRPGEGVRASLGIVGALGGPWRTMLGGRVARRIRTDAATFRGFSGGPLLTPEGAVLGINTAALSRDASTTLPTETVRRVVEALQQHGRMRRGYLGVTGQPVKLQGAPETGVGLLLVGVEKESPAAQAGLVVGDILLRVSGERVRHPGQLAALLGDDAIGLGLSVTVVRAGTLTDLTVTVAERL